MAWNLLGGWHLDLLPMLCALYEIEDPAGLIDRLQVIRDDR